MAQPPTLPSVSSHKPTWVKECQYIEGETPKPEEMCRKPVKHGSVYCSAHHALCFIPLKPRPLMRAPE